MAKENLQPIIDQIEEYRTVKEGVKALLVNLTNRVLAAPTLADAQAVARDFQGLNVEMQEAVVAHTPVEDEPPAPPIE